ncbi:MAG: DUF1003 domain-containing protein [Patescibacteria group bacterium]|jgi:uncharacterized membrane protein
MAKRKTQIKKKAKITLRSASALRSAAIFAAKMNHQRSLAQKMADIMTSSFGSMSFLGGNALLFLFWILVNTKALPLFPAIDPYPFFLLTTFVSLEAIFLSIIVLISENRAARVAELREEIDFQVNVQAEREITHILRMLDEIRHHLKISHEDDKEFEGMKDMIDVEKLEQEIQEEIREMA